MCLWDNIHRVHPTSKDLRAISKRFYKMIMDLQRGELVFITQHAIK